MVRLVSHRGALIWYCAYLGRRVTVGLLQQRYSVNEGETLRICAQMVGQLSKPLVVGIETGFSPILIGRKCIYNHCTACSNNITSYDRELGH